MFSHEKFTHNVMFHLEGNQNMHFLFLFYAHFYALQKRSKYAVKKYALKLLKYALNFALTVFIILYGNIVIFTCV